MKIVTVNLPVAYLNAIESLTGDDGLYPSRSELIRVAMKDFLMREVASVKNFLDWQEKEEEIQEREKEKLTGIKVSDEHVIIGEKTYRIIKK